MQLEDQRLAVLKIVGYEEDEPWLDGRRCFIRTDTPAGFDLDNLPYYYDSLDDIYGVENFIGLHDRSNTELRVKWINILRDLAGRDCPKNKGGTSLVSDIDLCFASSLLRCEALLKLMKVWVVKV